MSSTDKTKAIDKIKKLLAVATSHTANPQEAETAMRMARSLMAQHNLDQGAFDGLGSSSFGKASFDTIWCVNPKKPISPFMTAFIGLLRSVFNVAIVIHGKPLYRGLAFIETRASLEFYGDKVDVQLCEYSAAVVWRSLNADREVYAREHALRGLPMASQRVVLQSYSIAWLHAAREKLAATFTDEAKLAAAKVYKDLVCPTSPSTVKKYMDYASASGAGSEAGSKFNISRPVGAQQKTLT